MSEIAKINIGDATYDIKDNISRDRVYGLTSDLDHERTSLYKLRTMVIGINNDWSVNWSDFNDYFSEVSKKGSLELYLNFHIPVLLAYADNIVDQAEENIGQLICSCEKLDQNWGDDDDTLINGNYYKIDVGLIVGDKVTDINTNKLTSVYE